MTRIHFTKDALEALPIKARPYRVYDDDERYLAAEIMPTGRVRFLVRRRPEPGAPPRQWNLGELGAVSVAQAREAAYSIRRAILRGEVQAERTYLRLEQFWDVYRERHLASLSRATQRAYNDAWIKLKPLHHRTLERITRADVARLHGEIGAESPAWADKVRACLSSVLGRAEEWGYVDDLPKMPKPFGQRRRDRWLTRDEVRRLLAAVDNQPPPLGDLVRLLLLTGSRKMEVCAMRWDQLRMDDYLWLRMQKGNVVAPTALSQAAVDLLRARPAKSPWVFPSVRGGGHIVSPDKPWRAARAAAGLPDITLHVLRHTHASWLANANVPLQVISAQLGHRQTSTTERYAHLAIGPQREAVEVVAGVIG